MNPKLKTICLILITSAIAVSAVFYCWSLTIKTQIRRIEAEAQIMKNKEYKFLDNVRYGIIGEKEVKNYQQHLWDFFNY